MQGSHGGCLRLDDRESHVRSHRITSRLPSPTPPHDPELSNDPIIRNHLAALYDTLMEQNLLRVIEPYSRVEIAYIAERVRHPLADVETKLSQMILVRKFHGILDQGNGCLVVFDEPPEDVSGHLASPSSILDCTA